MRHGVLLIDKPAGPTSHDIVQRVREILHERSIGHLGTLDPAATGLLVLFIGKKALKTIELFQNLSKSYEARIVFGKISSTYDREGVIEDVPERKGWSPPKEGELQEILRKHFLGDISQIPPAHSAVHIDGERAYDIIRRNPQAEISLTERTITISRIQLLSYQYPDACLAIDCSSGTYIRSLAHDLGKLIRSGAYLSALKRTKVGSWFLSDAVNSESVTWADVIPLKEILVIFPRFDLSEEEWGDVQHGRSLSRTFPDETVIAWYENLPVAILTKKEGKAHPRKVL